jgi:hypothetical protein
MNGAKHPENSFYYAFWGHLGTPKSTQQGMQRPASGQDVCPNIQAPK